MGSIDAIGCEVEADVAHGGQGEIKLVGLADTAVKESISRIQAALRNSGYRWPGLSAKRTSCPLRTAPEHTRRHPAEKRKP